MANVHLSGELRRLAGGASGFDVAGDTIREVIAELDRMYPGLGAHLADGVSVAIDGEIMSNAEYVRVPPTADVHFLPSIGGG